MRDSLKARIEPIHVRGHQDRTTTKLTRLEVLNIRMDRLAKEIRHAVITEDVDIPDALPMSSDGLIQVDYEDIPITSSLASTLQFFVGRDRILKWWKAKKRFRPDTTAEDIDWEILRRTAKEHSFPMKPVSYTHLTLPTKA